MRETENDIQHLQQLLDTSIEQAGKFLRASFQMPEHSLSARQIVQHMEGIPTISMATVTARGEPRVAPIGSLLVRGKFHIPTVKSAARVRHLKARPAISMTYYEGVDLALIAHGMAQIVDPDHEDFKAVDAELVNAGSESVLEWESGGGLYVRVNPETLYTFARYPERFPG